jgi:uncharacterized protein YfaS (alpha-2-macroglobulin family)
MRRGRSIWISLWFWTAFLAGCSPPEDPEPEASPGAVATEERFSATTSSVASHTSGRISREGDVRIRFVDPQVEDAEVGREAPGLLHFEPAIAGTAAWHTTRELRFLPAEPLKSDARYQVTLREREGSKPLRFSIRVIRQDFEVRFDGLGSDPSDPGTRVLTGSVETADVASPEAVEKLLVASYVDDPREIQWQHAPNRKSHRFSIAKIVRQQNVASIRLRWDGGAIGVQNQGEREIEVPALGVFKVAGTHPMDAGRDHILVTFSDDLDPRQDLEGLVRLDGREVRHEIRGNAIRVYPNEGTRGDVTVQIAAGVKNRAGAALGKAENLTVHIEARRPAVRFVGRGVVLPNNDTLSIPFEAIAVDSVQVTAFEIYDDNIGRFLQDNQLDGQRQLRRVGRHLWRKTIELAPEPGSGWSRYSLDATELLEKHRGSLIRLQLSIHRGNSTYTCEGEADPIPDAPEEPLKNYDDLNAIDPSYWDGWENPMQPGDFRHRNDPCKDAYYRLTKEARAARNFLASDIGLLAKRGAAQELFVVATHLSTAEPMEGVELTIYNFQNQLLGGASTDAAGLAQAMLEAKPFYLVARKGDDRAYLKLADGAALATSHFDVGGQTLQRGVKGQLYGERGVWRPGDTLHLTFVLNDEDDSLPPKHPVTLTLTNPSGQKVHTQTNAAPVGDFYRFSVPTSEDAPTGRWMATARLGGLTFAKPIRIETVIPNRLKTELELGGDILRADELPRAAEIFGQWLHGADAAGLEADVRFRLEPRPTRFPRNTDYSFDDPARSFASVTTDLFKGKLDEGGRAKFDLELPVKSPAQGQLTVHFTTRVFEESGAFSTERLAVPFHPYTRYVGIKLPPGDEARGMLLTDQDHVLEIATLDSHGEPVSAESIDVRLYKIDWRWWWDRSGESLAQYASATHHGLLQHETVATNDGAGQWSFRIDHPAWGRYLVRACDRDGGHCAGKIVYIDWPGWAGRAQEQGNVGATALSFSSDKERYTVGETARITLPATLKGRALVSLETGSERLDSQWVDIDTGDNTIEVPISREMVPNVYVSVVLLQPHADKQSDLPIRLYGYLPFEVESPETRLEVELTAPEEIRPQTATSIEVSEAEGRPMTYTLALVDEGLLGLTRFQTPDLHAAFYAREALGVRTWDLFDFVVGAYGGELERLLALGGGGSLEPVEQQKKRRRFPPVVEFLGPFALEAGARGSHTIELPEYIGAVRVMVVGGHDGAYGSAEKSVFVRDKLMLQATLPRVLGPGERVALPVAVFATDPNIRDVVLEASTQAPLQLVGDAKKQLRFEKPGDQITDFDLQVGDALGIAGVRVEARSGDARAEQNIHIEVRSPNERTLRQQRAHIEPGESWTEHVVPHGLMGTNEVALEISSVPPLNLERRLDYLIRYPYGCVEQTTSSIFPQLFLSELTKLDPKQKQEIEDNLASGIEKLRGFQLASGAFGYWPGAAQVHDWATSYAGHFLVEASRKGYHVPVGILPDWLAHQRSMAQSWIAGGRASSFEQAYRLYTLALAGEPEIGAMNRLRETDSLNSPARWLLAAAYREAGLPDAANDLVKGDAFAYGSYDTTSRTFGSKLRDKAIFLSGLVALDRIDEGAPFVESISADLASDHWHSTQSTVWSLLALSRYVGGSGTPKAFTARYALGDGPDVPIQSEASIARVPLENFPAASEQVGIANDSERRLYATLSTRGVPKAGTELAAAQGLKLDVRYSTVAGSPIDVSALTQGKDFVASVEVTNTRERPLENLALTHVVPSGWEIHNPRFDASGKEPAAEVDYQDIRDDRVHTYFSLKGGEKKTFQLLLNAAYRGRYYLPAVQAEAMYDATVNGRTRGQWIEVVDRDAR